MNNVKPGEYEHRNESAFICLRKNENNNDVTVFQKKVWDF